MFLINITYTEITEESEALLPAHVKYLERYYDNGTFVLSGGKVPRTGGVIMANGTDKKTLTKVMQEDPFYPLDNVQYELIQFEAKRVQLKNFIG